MFDLSGKKALITGATGGLGGAIATLFHQHGADVILTGTREEVLQERAAELGNRAHAHACNLGDGEAIEALAKHINDEHGGVDILINNAGLTRDGLLMRMKDEDWQQVIDVNLTASFRLVKALMRPMLKNKWGRIIGIASVVGVMGNAGQANYAASKAGMIGFMKSIAQELAAKNVTANTIAPGFITTAMTDALNEQQRDAMLSRIPVQRFGEVDDIAAAALYLASDEASYVTGQTLHVNGGMIMP